MNPKIVGLLDVLKNGDDFDQRDEARSILGEVFYLNQYDPPPIDCMLPLEYRDIVLDENAQRELISALLDIFHTIDNEAIKASIIFTFHHARSHAICEPILTLIAEHNEQLKTSEYISANVITCIEDCLFYSCGDIDFRIEINELFRMQDPREFLQYWKDRHDPNDPMQDQRAERSLNVVTQRINETREEALAEIRSWDEDD